MSKYFDTKPGSLEEAVSAAQQAAIAISKKEKGEKPKNEDKGQFSFVAAQAKKNGEKKFTFAGKEFEVEKVECPKCEGKGCDHCEGKGYHEEGFKTETNKNDKSDDGDGLDAVQPDAVKKKFDDRKDKDIDNDGDVDSSDKFLHKRRKAVSKSMGEALVSVAESVRMMWDEAAKKTEAQDMEQDKDGDGMDDDGKAKKTAKKTDSGKDMTEIETSVKMPKMKNEKNKV
jgi:hypothetical protein